MDAKEGSVTFARFGDNGGSKNDLYKEIKIMNDPIWD
jgi:hypothetical protein